MSSDHPMDGVAAAEEVGAEEVADAAKREDGTQEFRPSPPRLEGKCWKCHRGKAEASHNNVRRCRDKWHTGCFWKNHLREAVFQAVLKDTGGDKSAARAAALEAQEDVGAVGAVDAARTGRTAAMTACPDRDSPGRMPRCGACAACTTAERAVLYCADKARFSGGGGDGLPRPCERWRCAATMAGPRRTETAAATAACSALVQCRKAADVSLAVVAGCAPHRRTAPAHRSRAAPKGLKGRPPPSGTELRVRRWLGEDGWSHWEANHLL